MEISFLLKTDTKATEIIVQIIWKAKKERAKLGASSMTQVAETQLFAPSP